jgi:hypothetical protein
MEDIQTMDRREVTNTGSESNWGLVLSLSLLKLSYM